MISALRLSAIASGFAVIICGCTHGTPFRIQLHAAEFAALPSATQQAIRRGVVEVGYTMAMAEMALGQPSQVTGAGADTVWAYRQEPVTAANETIQSGYRRRVVYDPVKRSNDIVVEPIDAKAFPHLVPHWLRLTFRDGKLAAISRSER